jgi:DNA processing protein
LLSETRTSEYDPLVYWLWLMRVFKLGPVRIKTLLTLFNDDLSAVWHLRREQLLCIRGIDEKIADSIIGGKSKIAAISRDLDAMKAAAEATHAELLSLTDAKYPRTLSQMTISPPILFAKGQVEKFNQQIGAVAIVGTRGASQFGLSCAADVASQFAHHGWAVVSGLAKGIDMAAHKAALDAGGFTVGVLGCGVDLVYPPESQEIRQRMDNNGAVISEYPFKVRPSELNLRKRNKVTVGMAQAVIIIETGEKGGTFNAVIAANEQKKPIFVLDPGRPQLGFEGNSKLLHDGQGIGIKCEDAFNAVAERVAPWPVASS